MKQETNNEMDLLLRRLGRRDDAVAPEDHLDADELNAYAENALPTAARARYTLHLAECASCRSLVVQLSSAAGVVATTESAAVKEPSGWKKFLASLFTPMVLRYAAPALGLIVVAVVGFVVLRRDRAANYIAQETAQQHPAAAAKEEPSGGLVSSVQDSSPSPNGRAETTEKTQPARGVPPPPNSPPAVSSVESEVAKDKAVAQPKPEEQKAAANEPVKPEPTPAPALSPRAAEPEVAKNEVNVQAAPASQGGAKLRAAQREDRDSLARAKRQADSVNNFELDGVDDAKANIRTVAGRRFRKQNNVWIDTAYDAAKEATTLTRGSEQFRALVADEPAIKTIADQLDGEIIVVWKYRTYRIR